MIPEKLKIKGIYSYQKEVTINFDKLTTAGIFGIFGSVGSGKSTILEAISYALYGETERLNNRDSKLYNMMNLRSDEMEIDFEFRHQNERYRFTAFARRNSKNFDDISKSERKAYHLNSGEWEPLESADATYITGLKYDHFKQIVIIPQGKFNEFVQLSPADRTKMLRELFPLDRFDLRDQTNRLFSATKDAITSLEGRLQELDEYKSESVSVLNNDIIERKMTLSKLKDALIKKEKERSGALELRELIVDYTKAQTQFQLLQENKERIANLKLQIEKYEKTRLTYAHLLERLTELEEEILQRTKKIEKQHAENNHLTQQKVQLEKELSAIKEAIGDEEEHKKQVLALEKTIKIKRIEVDLKSLNETIKKLLAKKAEEEQKHKLLVESNQAKRKQLSELKKQLPDEGQLYQLRESYVEEDNVKQRLKAANIELQKVETLIANLTQERTDIVNAVYDILQTNREVSELKMNEAVTMISEALSKFAKDLSVLEIKREKLSVKSHLAAHAKELKPGEKCPLCGAVEHPEPYTDEKVATERVTLQKEIEKLQNNKELLSQSLVKLDGLKKRFIQEGSEVSERKQQVKELEEQLNACIAKQQKMPMVLSREKLAEAITNLESQKKSVALLEKQIQEVEHALNNFDSIVQIDKQIGEKENLRSQLNGQKLTLQEDVDEKWLSFGENELIKKSEQINKSMQSLNEADKNLSTIEKQIERNKIELEQNEKFQIELANKRAELQKQVDTHLANDKLESIDQVKRILAEQIDIEKSKAEIEEYSKELHLTENKLVELKSKVGDRTFDEAKFQELTEAFDALKSQISATEEQAGALQNQLDELNKKLAIKQKLQKELNELEKRKRNLEVLNRMFRGDGFVRWVSQIYLKQLCSIANERFKKLTHNQLELDVDDKYNFIVRDYLHEGKTRLLKTLSGGQTFQAALSLAMALSEQIQQYQNVKQQFFFMDEGFGSLDKESLSLVFDTLKQLRKEQRTVGIISHVEELQTEIDHAIFVKNDDEKGSNIEFSG
jgi:exonuclease SbcC